MTKKIGALLLVSGLTFSLVAQESRQPLQDKTKQQNVWQERLMVRDRISKEDGRVLEIVGFSLSKGDVMIEVDQVNRQIIAISGAFHDIDSEMFQTLQSRFTEKPLKGWITEENSETVDGEKDRMVRINVQDLGLTFPEDFIWTIRNSESLNLKLSLQKERSKKMTMTLEMNMGDASHPSTSNFTLVNNLQI